jgi:hypothetical protein
MIRALRQVVHEGATPDEAYDMFRKLQESKK